MNLSCVIVDDEAHSITILSTYVQHTSFLQLTFATTNPVEGLAFVQQNAVDVVFLDVRMPQLSGIQFLKLLGKKSNIILITAYLEYALEGYEYNVVDYLLKPISFERFLRATQKVLTKETDVADYTPVPLDDPAEMFVKTGSKGKLQKVAFSEIYYISSEGNYVSIYTSNDRIVTFFKIKDLQEQLPKGKFIRVHKSFIVAMDKIDALEKEQVCISRASQVCNIPLGDAYRKDFYEALDHKILRKRSASSGDRE